MTKVETRLLAAVKGLLGNSHDGTSHCRWCGTDFEREDLNGNYCENPDCSAVKARAEIAFAEAIRLKELTEGKGR